MPPKKKKQKKADPYVNTFEEAMDRIRREDLSLEILMLCSDNRIFEGGFNLKLMQQLGEAMKQHPSSSAKLLRIDLSHGRIGNKGLAAISESLGLCTNLQDLSLAACNIGDAGLLALSKHLSKCTALRKLNIYNSAKNDGGEEPKDPISDEGIVVFATHALPACTALTELNLRNHRIGDKGLSALSKGLRACSGLSCLVLNGNAFGAEGLTCLAASLRDCTSLRELAIGQSGRSIWDSTGPSWAVPLSERAALPVVEAVLHVWSQVRTIPGDDNTHVNGRCLNLGMNFENYDDSKSEAKMQERKKIAVAIGLALKANPPAQETDSRLARGRGEAEIITFPYLKDCLPELGVPEKCPISEYDWDEEGKLLCQWFRQTSTDSKQLMEWATKEIGHKMSAEEVQQLVDHFPWHLGPRKTLSQ